MISNSLIRKLIVCLGVFIVIIQSVHADDSRAIPDDNLSYPVLYRGAPVSGKIKMGSGFYLKKDNTVYFVTARHVLFSESSVKLEVLPEGVKISDSLIYRISYDQEKKELIFFGVMSEEDKAELIYSSTNQPLFTQAVEQLYKKSQTLQLNDETASLFSYQKS